jgi:BirA family biotin operon repressor/biotin-[acetyl-CoA-carboxylase] ligase
LQGDQWKFSVVGIGINVNQTAFPDDVPNATSLAAVTGKKYDPLLLARELCVIFEKMWQKIESGSREVILQEYNHKLFKLNEVVNFKIDNAVITAKVLGVNDNGELILDTGEEITVPIGQINWLLPN